MKKKIAVVLGMTMIVLSMTACGSNANKETNDNQDVNDAKTETVVETETDSADESEAVAEVSEYITYDIDTFDGDKVVIDETNIISQTPCDDPLEWTELPADAEQIAPGRDIVLFANASNYYVEDAAANLVTVAERENAEASDNASAAAEDVVFSNDDYSITYNTKNFEQYDVRGAIQFTYCNEDVQQAGSNVIIITKEENCKLDDMASTIANSRSDVEDVYDSVMGSQEIPSKIIVGTTADTEENGPRIVDNLNMIQCGDDVIIIESIRTLGNDDETEMTIDGAFVATLESFVLN